MAVSAIDDNFNTVLGPETACLTGNEETRQNILNCLCLRPGESCVFPEAGIDWLKEPFLSAPNRRVERRLRAKIEEIDGVDRVRAIQYIGTAGVDGRYCIEIVLKNRDVITIEDKLNG